ncbi:MAG: magnesium transporter CorA family protein [Acidimicrobiia bacterium]|nr:magnesium transporter CorA family protein [Acidimicrobiia bacterium]
MTMRTRVLHFRAEGLAQVTDLSTTLLTKPASTDWLWIDIEAGVDDFDELLPFVEDLGLDSLGVRDAVEDVDLPKVDDFGTSVLVVLHGLGEDRIETYEVDCFLTQRHLVTIRRQSSPSVDVLWDAVQRRAELGGGGADTLLARLADVLTRRLLSVLDVFDNRADDLVELALSADKTFLGEITAVRSDLATLRRAIHPQREVLDELRYTSSPMLSDTARRRFSDVFDTATRAAQGADGARAALAETLDAYRGAEARDATEVSKVLTVYAAIMLPLTLVVGFFGMNFSELPLIERDAGWLIVTVFMGLIAAVSLGVFISLGWMRRPSGRAAGAALGHGLVEAARAPAQLVGAVYEISAMPLRSVAAVRRPRLRAEPPEGPA